MTTSILSRRLLVSTSVFAITAALLTMPAAPAVADTYMSGDFHNHTTCTDGTVSIETMITKSIQTFGLEWMASADHGGNGVRDCRFDDPEGDGSVTGSGKFWEETVTVAGLKGDVATSSGKRVMWRWQMIEEIVFPEVVRLSGQFQNPVIYAGLETNAPGHEHVSMSALGAQRAFNYTGDVGNASATAEFEFRFDRSDTDMSGKGGTPGVVNSGIWKGKVANASGAGQGTANHNNKAVPSVAWLQTNFPLDSYYVPAHVERAGVFDPNGNRGFNVEHFRDFNNAGPTVAVGFETMPGHQAGTNRGEYRKDFGGAGIDSVGVTTYGGTGIYGAKVGGLWDALLGEGRNWFFYASSDWHNRGTFDPYSRQSTQDFYPGEYQRLYIPRPAAGTPLRPQHIFDSVRAGNSFSVSGDLITKEFTYTAEVVGLPGAVRAKMGETLVVPRGRPVRITLEVNLPTTPNNSPYSFNNPSLMQLSIQEPLNRPTLRQVDFIRGNVTGVIPKDSPNYTNATNPSATVVASFSSANWTASGQKRTMSYVIPSVQTNQYVRVRGTNLPVGTQNETDPQGNPLSDPIPTEAQIPCLDAACPAHMAVVGGTKRSTYDVAAWADLWFYSNPIFIRVSDQPKLLVETNADKAKALKQALAR